MKKATIICLFLALSLTGFAQLQMKPRWNGILNDHPEAIRIHLISSTEKGIRVKIQVPGFYLTNVNTPRGESYVISVPKAVSTANAGEPDVPMIGVPFLIGDHARMQVKVVDAEYVDYPIEVAPSKGDFSRQIDPSTVPYTYGDCYKHNKFFPEEYVALNEPYIIRDFRGQNISVHPFVYNPMAKTLRVYYHLTMEMYKVDGQGTNVIESRRSNTVIVDPDFKSVYQRHFINYDAATAKYTPLEEEGDLLIICYDNLISAMTDFVNWKKIRGINTTIVGTSTTGSTYSDIKSYIQNQYNANNNLTHVLLVGDAAQIPGYPYSGGGSWSGLGDNPYGQIVGDDIYNDVFIGRFSANTLDQVATQVQRVITYERDLTDSATWCQKGLGVSASESNGGHNNEDDYQHVENLRTDLLNYGYSTVYQDYRNVSGYPNSTTTTISNHINSGVGIINYCNHGEETAWQSHYYRNSHVNALTNSNQLPVIFSVACLNGKYDYSEGDCFAEAWMHATNNSTGVPTGAVGTLMSYISQPWIPPMWAQDEFVDIIIDSYTNNIKHTWGGAAINSIMAIFDHYSTSIRSALGTYQSWILYGDPTMTLRTKTPQTMNVTHSGSIMENVSTYMVSVSNGNGSLATITDADHNIIGKAVVSNGFANIDIIGALSPCQALTLCVFGYNKVTYLGSIIVLGDDNVYSITRNQPQHGTIIAPEQACAGATVTLEAITETGYKLSDWIVKDANDNSIAVINNQFTMPESNVVISATIVSTLHSVNVSANPSEWGMVTGGGIYLEGLTCTVTAMASEGYLFSNWTEGEEVVSNEAEYSFEVLNSRNLVAIFRVDDNIHFADANVKAVCVANWDTDNDGEISYAEAAAVTDLGHVFIYNSTITCFDELQYFTGLVSIGQEAFYHCTKLNSIVIPQYVTSIGICAFSNTSFHSIVIPNSVTSIEISAFNACKNLYSIVIPNSVTSIGHGILSACDSLELISVDSDNNKYDSRENCNAIIETGTNKLIAGCKNTIIPNTVTAIENYAFSFCKDLNELIIPNSLTSIGTMAFSNCVGLTSIISYASTPPTLGNNAFSNVDMSIPLHVPCEATSAYAAASGWNAFTNVIEDLPCNYEIVVEANPSEWGMVIGGGSYLEGSTCTVTAMASEGYLFSNWTEGEEVVSNEAEYSFEVLNSRNLVANFRVDDNIHFADANVKAVCVTNWDTDNDGEISYAEAAAVTDLGEAFRNNHTIAYFDELQYFTGLVLIGQEAFNNCFSLTSIVIPNSVTSIGNSAFKKCKNLYSIVIPNSVTSIGNSILSACDALELISVDLNNNKYDSRENCNAIIETGTNKLIAGCKNTIIPNTVTTIEQYAFHYCKDLYELIIPNSVTKIGLFSFGHCNNLVSIEIPNSLTSIATRAFSDCTGLTSIISYASTPPTLGNNAFSNVDMSIPLHVPCGATSAYAAASGWNAFTNVIEDLPCNYEIVVEANPSEWGMVTGGGSYLEGSTCTVTAMASEGYLFSNWTEGEEVVSNEAEYSFEVLNSRYLVANFRINTCVISAVANDLALGTVSGGGTYNKWETVALIATAHTGALFRNWTENDTVVSCDFTYSFVADDDRSFVAVFDRIEVTELTAGWNWWSTYIELSGIDGLGMLESSLGHDGLAIKSQNEFTTNYYGSVGYDYWYGGLESLTNEQGYMISTGASLSVNMIGRPAKPTDHPITLHPQWSWIGYPVIHEQSLATALGDFQPENNDVMKDQLAFATYYAGYGWYPEDFVMSPGKGYMYNSNAASDRTLTYAADGNSKGFEAMPDKCRWIPCTHDFMDNISVIAVVNVEGDELREDAEVGAFVNGVCRGATRLRCFEPTGRYYALLSIAGEDGDLVDFGMPGLKSNSHLTFHKNDIVGSLDSPMPITFQTGSSVAGEAVVYPNPAGCHQEVTLAVRDKERIVKVLLTNLLGEVVQSCTTNDTHASLYIPRSGVYLVKAICESGVVYQNKIVIY